VREEGKRKKEEVEEEEEDKRKREGSGKVEEKRRRGGEVSDLAHIGVVALEVFEEKVFELLLGHLHIRRMNNVQSPKPPKICRCSTRERDLIGERGEGEGREK